MPLKARGSVSFPMWSVDCDSVAPRLFRGQPRDLETWTALSATESIQTAAVQNYPLQPVNDDCLAFSAPRAFPKILSALSACRLVLEYRLMSCEKTRLDEFDRVYPCSMGGDLGTTLSEPQENDLDDRARTHDLAVVHLVRGTVTVIDWCVSVFRGSCGQVFGEMSDLGPYRMLVDAMIESGAARWLFDVQAEVGGPCASRDFLGFQC
jgi:hypothetical protein